MLGEGHGEVEKDLQKACHELRKRGLVLHKEEVTAGVSKTMRGMARMPVVEEGPSLESVSPSQRTSRQKDVLKEARPRSEARRPWGRERC